MKILSIDVGMRNLAYCISDKQEDNSYTIIKWDIIDLCKEPINKCSGFKKNGEKCSSISKYHKNNIYYCKTHAKTQPLRIPESNMKVSKIKKMKKGEIVELSHKLGYDIALSSNKAVYVEHLLTDLLNNYLDLVTKTDCKSINIVTYGSRIKSSFDELILDSNIDCVIIENQIGPLALRMKMLQGMIMQHFIERGVICIKEISPANKLKDYISNKKTTYAERKRLGIDVTRKLLNDNPDISSWSEYFEKHTKKDDLADSFLQLLWYIKR
jgi:hypothetical protein